MHLNYYFNFIKGAIMKLTRKAERVFNTRSPNLFFNLNQVQPFKIFSLDELGLNQAKTLKNLQKHFRDLPEDMYDVRRQHLELLMRKKFDITPTSIKKYFEEGIMNRDIKDAIKDLNVDDKYEYESYKPWRQRSISTFKIHLLRSGIHITRVPTNQFTQDAALIQNDTVDFRMFNRVFAETKISVTNNPHMVKLIESIIKLVSELEKTCTEFEINIHHTKVNAFKDLEGDNSPEGVHQDGYDYIVSALVIDRFNIKGGMSKVYIDMKKELIDITLPSGYGLLQADKNSMYWHKVTKFQKVNDTIDDAYRSTIGFDIACKN